MPSLRGVVSLMLVVVGCGRAQPPGTGPSGGGGTPPEAGIDAPAGSQSLTVETPATGPVAAGQAIVLLADQASFTTATVAAAFDGAPVTAASFGATRLVLLVPDASPGDHMILVPGFAAVTVTIKAVAMPDDPASFVSGHVDALASALPPSAPGDKLGSYASDARQRLDALRAQLASASPEDVRRVAAMIAANRSLFDAVEQSDGGSQLLDSWERNALGLIAAWKPFVAVAGLAVVATATGSGIIAVAAVALAVIAYNKLERRYDAVEEPVFTTLDSFGNERRAHLQLSSPLVFAQGQPGPLGISATFRSVTAADVTSQDPLVRQVAEIGSSIGGAVGEFDDAIDPDLAPPLSGDGATVVRPLTANDVTVTGATAAVTVTSAADAPLELLVDVGSCPAGAALSVMLKLQVRDIDGFTGITYLQATLQCACGGNFCATDQTCITCGGTSACATAGSGCCGGTVTTPDEDCCGATSPPTVIGKGEPCCANHFLCPIGTAYFAVPGIDPPDGSPVHCCRIITSPSTCMFPYPNPIHAVRPVDHDCNGLPGSWDICADFGSPRHCQP